MLRLRRQRAGEAGKGFAVVADEIRELADETKESTENIEQVLENFIGKIEDMVKTVTHTAETVQQNSEIMEKANTSFENIASDLMRTNEEVQTLHNDCVNLQDNNAKIVDQISICLQPQRKYLRRQKFRESAKYLLRREQENYRDT